MQQHASQVCVSVARRVFAGVPPGPRELLARVLESPSCRGIEESSGPRLARPRRWGGCGEAGQWGNQAGLQSVFLLLPLAGGGHT